MKNYFYFDCQIFEKCNSRQEDDPNDVGFYSCKTTPNAEFEFAFNVNKSILKKIVSDKKFQEEIKLLIEKHISMRVGQKENNTIH